MQSPPQDDPYESTPRAPEPAGVAYETTVHDQASLSQRFGNFIIDRIFGLAVALLMSGLHRLILPASLRTGPKGESAAANLLWFVMVFGALFLYYTAQEALYGRTLGKRITGTRVVNAEGGRPTWGQATLRTLCRLVPFEALTFLGASQRGLHDVASGTWVVRIRRPDA